MAGALNSLDAAVERARLLLGKGRRLLGLVGKPGSGKSTLAKLAAERLGAKARLVPMDGYHLSNKVLRELGRAKRKGAVDTFDALGYTMLLKRIRNEPHSIIYHPVFHREIEESITAEGVVSPDVDLVISEGNYLLHPQDGWGGVRELLDESWYVEVDDEVRVKRLIQRRLGLGNTMEEAVAWTTGSDEVNAQIIGKTRQFADVIVTVGELPLEAR
ncbi:MAG: nucleoside/nucleotide kinase family protein [Verrucomicrobia bacterium]|nr:nucleoside/nucleotide kinase family protein [Verrucomicrobiota bacterium]